MLANLLPGLRHLRTQLATGYLYLFNLWLILGDRLVPAPSDDDSPGRIAQLADLVGATATLSAVSFAAYLLGSILVISRLPASASPLDRLHYGRGYYEPWAQGLEGLVDSVAGRVGGRFTVRDVLSERSLPPSFVDELRRCWLRQRQETLEEGVRLHELIEKTAPIDVEDNPWRREREPRVQQHRQRTIDELNKLDLPERIFGALDDPGRLDSEDDDPWWQMDEHPDDEVSAPLVSRVLHKEIRDEIERVTARLRVQSESVFNEYDRRRSEAELRYSLVPPLVLAIVVLSVTWQWWALAGLVIPAVLLRHAIITERASVGVVIDAMRYGVVDSPTAQTLIRLAE